MKHKIITGTLAGLCFIVTLQATPKHVVSFEASMSNYKKYFRYNLPAQDKQWALLKDLYNTLIRHNKNPSEKPIIPKIIHQIWLGGPFPEKNKLLRDTWLKKHPDWEYILWTEKEIEAFGLENMPHYKAAINYGEKSDIARYEILYRIGGLYIDTDFECLRPFDFFHHRCAFYTGLCIGKDQKPKFANGLIGSIPHHPILKQCIDEISKSKKARDNKPESIMARTGPYFFTKCFFNIVNNCSTLAVALPCNYFYPWPHFHRKENNPRIIKEWIKPESFAIHHWHRSWVKEEKQNNIQPKIQKRSLFLHNYTPHSNRLTNFR